MSKNKRHFPGFSSISPAGLDAAGGVVHLDDRLGAPDVEADHVEVDHGGRGPRHGDLVRGHVAVGRVTLRGRERLKKKKRMKPDSEVPCPDLSIVAFSARAEWPIQWRE